ncbi:MAG: DUF488 family protein [Proteobacteria bacterium]|nr:DUF488 family protein [Pseudomonadota bacterium]
MVGHSTRPIGEFIALPQACGTERLIDIRTVPRSRHNPQFDSDAVGDIPRAAAIGYVPMPTCSPANSARWATAG